MFNNRPFNFKFQCSTKIQNAKKFKLKGKLNIQRNAQCSVIKISPTAIHKLFSGKFNIQYNIQYSLTKIHSTVNSTFKAIFNIQ